MSKCLYLITIILFCFKFSLYAKDYSPEDIINPNIENRRVYVADPENLIGAAAKTQTNEILWKLRRTTGSEVVIVVVPNTGEYSEEDFATQLFDKWKIGKSDKDNGVLILIVPEQKSARIATGYGVEGIIPDILALKIINRSIVPNMKLGNINKAVIAVAQDVSNVLSDPDAVDELRSNKKDQWEEMPESDISAEDIISFLLIIIFGVTIFSFCLFLYDNTRFKKLDRYLKARSWHDQQATYLYLAILSLGLGLIPYWLAKKRYKDARNKPMICPACKGKMKKLNEEEDNLLLSPSQDMEEKLNSVDYDVWICDECGSIERFAFPNKNSLYQECPQCKTKAMYEVRNHTLVPATTRKAGIGERIFDCKYCHNQTKKRYIIPKREDGRAAALATGAILGSGRGSSGSFGGGFGGGSTGGGGATGRW